jgi:uncharacterized ion transporter superfamily protein YfcC
LLLILIILALITVLMGAAGVPGVTPATVADVVTAPVLGFQNSVGVCLFVLVLGGFLAIMQQTGALDGGVAALVRALHGHELALIPVLMALFSIGGTTYGMCEEAVPFYLLVAATMVAAGFDSLTGAAVVLLGAGSGVIGSTVNPFAVGVAVDALAGAGIAVDQAQIMAIGAALWLISLAVCTAFVMAYARQVRANRGSCFLSMQEQQESARAFGPHNAQNAEGVTGNISPAQASNSSESATGAAPATAAAPAAPAPPLTARQKWALAAFAFTFIIMIVAFIPWPDLGIYVFDAGQELVQTSTFVDAQTVAEAFAQATGQTVDLGTDVVGVVTTTTQETPAWSAFLTGQPFGNWYFNEATAWFLLMAIVLGFIGGVAEPAFVRAFVAGAAEMMGVVLVIAMARSITVLMTETSLDLWILDNAAAALAGMPALAMAPLAFLLYVVLSFLIPSSSGMATVSMPIMGALAQQLGFSVEVMVAIFCAGNGLVNLFTPTNGAIMGGLALAKVDYTTWLRFARKLIIILGAILLCLLTALMLLL